VQAFALMFFFLATTDSIFIAQLNEYRHPSPLGFTLLTPTYPWIASLRSQ